MISTEPDQLWIDMHAHLFNANDLPVKGFIANAFLPGWMWLAGDGLGSALKTAGRRTPTYDADTTALADLIASGDTKAPIIDPSTPPRSLLRHIPWVGRMLAEATRSRITLAYALDERCTDTGDDEPCDGDLVHALTLQSKIDLYVPLCVDLEWGSRDQGPSSPQQQFDFMRQLSDASLLGTLPNFTSIILPMVGFDPRRQDDDGRNSLQHVKSVVCRGEAIGVKMYPAMGFNPLGNVPPIDDRDDGAEIDRRLRDFYDWCSREQVPITAHCSPANTVKEADECAHPRGWEPVLEDYSELRLNLAHVGGVDDDDWLTEVAAMIPKFSTSHLFCDVGNHDLVKHEGTFFPKLLKLSQQDPTNTFVKRMMFGSDYWFLLMHRRSEKYLRTYARGIRCTFRHMPDVYPSFSGGAAQTFLGFDDPTNKNRIRVLDRMNRLEKPVGWVEPAAFTRLMTPPSPPEQQG